MDMKNEIERLEYWNELLNHHGMQPPQRLKALGQVMDVCLQIIDKVKRDRRVTDNDENK